MKKIRLIVSNIKNSFKKFEAKDKGYEIPKGSICLVITNMKNGASKIVDVTNYTMQQFELATSTYARVFDVQIKANNF